MKQAKACVVGVGETRLGDVINSWGLLFLTLRELQGEQHSAALDRATAEIASLRGRLADSEQVGLP